MGSPHTPSNYIWHIAMAVQGLTSTSKEEKLEILENMAATTGGKGVMHEGFCCEDDTKFSQPGLVRTGVVAAEKLFLIIWGYQLEK